VAGQDIVGHEALAEGVFTTIYANGGQIIVNYTDQPVVHGKITIEAKDAVFVERTP
jgi:hypothetical protein